MKVLFKHLIGGYTGKADNLCLYYNKYLNKVIIRRIPKVKLTQQHTDFALVSAQLRKLNLSQPYKDDFRVYSDLYSRLRAYQNNPPGNWYALFVRMMYDLQKAMPESVDLKTITRAQIESEDLPCRTVKQAVQAGLLPVVRNYQNLDKVL